MLSVLPTLDCESTLLISSISYCFDPTTSVCFLCEVICQKTDYNESDAWHRYYFQGLHGFFSDSSSTKYPAIIPVKVKKDDIKQGSRYGLTHQHCKHSKIGESFQTYYLPKSESSGTRLGYNLAGSLANPPIIGPTTHKCQRVIA